MRRLLALGVPWAQALQLPVVMALALVSDGVRPEQVSDGTTALPDAPSGGERHQFVAARRRSWTKGR